MIVIEDEVSVERLFSTCSMHGDDVVTCYGWISLWLTFVLAGSLVLEVVTSSQNSGPGAQFASPDNLALFSWYL